MLWGTSTIVDIRRLKVKMRKVSDVFLETIKTHIVGSITFFFENRAFNEIMWKNFVDPGRPETMSIRTRISRAMTKATDTN